MDPSKTPRTRMYIRKVSGEKNARLQVKSFNHAREHSISRELNALMLNSTEGVVVAYHQGGL